MRFAIFNQSTQRFFTVKTFETACAALDHIRQSGVTRIGILKIVPVIVDPAAAHRIKGEMR